MRKTPAGQRPRISQNKSAGWSWLRLLPIHEQQARASLESHSSGGSPDTHSMHQNEQNHSPEGMTEKLHTKAAPAHAPATNAEGNAPEAKSAAATVTFDHRPSNKGEGSVSGSAPEATTTGATEGVDHQPSSEADGSVSPISEPDFQPPETKGSSRSPSAVHFSAGDVSDAGDRPHAEPITTSKTDSHETKEQSLDSKEDRLLPSLPDEPVNEIEAAEQQPEANVGLRRGTISSVTTTTGSSSKDDLRSQPEIAHAIDSGSSAKDQPDAGTGTRRGTNSSVTSVLKDQGIFHECRCPEFSRGWADHCQEVSGTCAMKKYLPPLILKVSDSNFSVII